MAFVFSNSIREVLEQVVRDPRFKELTNIPVIAFVPLALITTVYLVLYLTTRAYIEGELNAWLLIPINGVAIYAIFTPLHDATHRTVSSNRLLNDLLGTVACFPLLPGITTGIYRYLHLEHHRFTGDPSKDPDDIFVVTRAPWALFVLATPDVSWSLWYIRHWNSRPIKERIEFSIGLSIYVGIHAYFLTSAYALTFFICWMIPQRIGATLVTYFFARIQHPEDVTWEKAPFQTTVFIPCGRFARYLMLAQSEHCVHHFLPSVPFYRYHRAWLAGQHLFEKQNIPTRGFFKPATSIILPVDDSLDRFQARISEIRSIADDVKTFEILPATADAELPRFSAGAHIDIEPLDGKIRQYSLCNSPLEPNRYQIAVKRDANGRGGSVAMHDLVSCDQLVQISKPRNNFPLNPEAEKFLLIAAGIGLTPLLSMAYQLQHLGKPFTFHILARSRSALAFADELLTMPFNNNIKIHLDDEPKTKFSPAEVLSNRAPNSEIYLCGPAKFMEWVMAEARQQHWPDDALFSEAFVAPRHDSLVNQPFEVELARSGKILTVGADEFLIDVVNAAKAGIPCSCTQGICGSCITPVISGDIEHRDAILSDAERSAGNKMCVCVGRAHGRLVLDV